MDLKVSQGAVSVASTIAGTVANLIVPGSGTLVAGVVQAGAPILQGIADLFGKKKDAGKTDQAAAAAVAMEMDATQRAYIEKVAQLDAAYQQYMSSITAMDVKLATLIKREKIAGRPVNISAIYAGAVASGAIDPAGLGVYSYLVGQKGDVFVPSVGSQDAGAVTANIIVPGGKVTKVPPPRYMSIKRIAAVVLLGLSAWALYDLAPKYDKAEAARKTRQYNAKKARRVKKEKAEAEAEAKRKARAPRRPAVKKAA